MKQILNTILVFLLFGLSRTDNDFTVEVKAGTRECYFETLKKDTEVELEYQVIDGGDLKIDVTLHTPTGTLIFSDYLKSEYNHKFNPTESGEYQLCFDNGVSSYYDKIVFFEIVVDGSAKNEDEDDDDDDYFGKLGNKDVPKDFEEYDSKVNDFKYRLERIRNKIENIGHLQTTTRSIESRDRHLAERNFEKVNFWSLLNLAVMVTVLVIQVFLIRSLFDEKSILSRQLNNLSSLVSTS